MQKFTVHQGLVAPMDRENVDTDAIIPKQFLKSIKRTGFGPNLFDEWRYLDQPGEPGVPESARKPNPDFVLNQPRYAGASACCWPGKNFGCGSIARARALGAGPVRLSHHHRAQLRRHLLQQLLQERPAAHRAVRDAPWTSCSMKRARFPGLPADRGPGAPGHGSQAATEPSSPFEVQAFPSSYLPDSTALTTSA
jgi:hypothetical protein